MCGFVCGFCLPLGLSVCWACILCLFVSLCNLCLALGLSVCPSEQVMFGMGFVCLSV